MMSKDPRMRPSASSILKMKEMQATKLELKRTYPRLFSNLISKSKSRKRKNLELEIQEDDLVKMNKCMIRHMKKGTNKRYVNSTKNRVKEKSIFSVIEKAKAKSNGTTPQSINITPHSTDTSNNIGFFTQIKRPMGEGNNSKTQKRKPSTLKNLTYFPTATKMKRPASFISPSNLSNLSPNNHFRQYPSRKRSKVSSGSGKSSHSKKGFTFISAIFGKHNPQSPGRQELATNFLKDKLGEEKFKEILDLKEAFAGLGGPESEDLGLKNRKRLEEECMDKVRIILGKPHYSLIPIIRYIFAMERARSDRQQLKTKPKILKTGRSFKEEKLKNIEFGYRGLAESKRTTPMTSPISQNTISTNTHEDDPNVTFGPGQLYNNKQRPPFGPGIRVEDVKIQESDIGDKDG